MEKKDFLIKLKKELYIAGCVYDRLVIDTIEKHKYDLLEYQIRERLYKISNDITDLYEELKTAIK